MRYSAKHIFVLAVLALFAFEVRAQKLSVLPQASEVVTGTLPNGISFYLVTNTSTAGYADFALVQKGAVDEALSREALSELPHFQKESPYQFLAKHGVGPEKCGYFSRNATYNAFKFSDVPVSDKSVSDTTLLMLFDISERYPYEQAVIVSGDIKVAEIRERMNVFSMMVTPRIPGPAVEENVHIGDEMVVESRQPEDEVLSRVRADYSLARTPRQQMKSVQPIVTEMFARCLSIAVRDRLTEKLRVDDTPVAAIDVQYKSSSNGPGAEHFVTDIVTDREHLEAATRALGDVLADIDAHGISPDEYGDAKDELLSSVHKTASYSTLSNAEYIDRCTSAFLFGSSLASRSAIDNFLTTRNIDMERESRLFNTFASALLDPQRGLTLTFDADAQTLAKAFSSSWNEAAARPTGGFLPVSRGDTLSLSRNVPKVKLKVTASEPVTGGQMWTFSNGMQVIWCKKATKGTFSYAWMLNEGTPSVPSIAQGECGFIGEILPLCDVAGLNGREFSRMLRSNGISLSTEVGLSDMRISGSAPTSRLELLLKSLLAISHDRTPNASDYDYYCRCSALSLRASQRTQGAVNEVLDSLLCPDYKFSSKRELSGLTDDLQERANKYFDSQLSHCQNGILLLVGDLDQFELKKVLSRYLGGFGTSRHRSLRPQVAKTLRSGTTTYTEWSGEAPIGDGVPSVYVSIATRLPYSLEREMSFRMALMALKKELVQMSSPCGLSVDVSGRFEILPSENVNVHLRFTPVPESGLPQDVEPSDPLVAISAIRNKLASLSSVSVSADDLKAWKAVLTSELSAELSDNAGLTEAVMARYSLGKDRVSGRSDKLKAIKADSIQEILSALSSAGRVEYIVY